MGPIEEFFNDPVQWTSNQGANHSTNAETLVTLGLTVLLNRENESERWKKSGLAQFRSIVP